METRTTLPIAGAVPNARATPATRRAGLDIVLDGDQAAREPVVSETWTVAGWSIQFARLGSRQGLDLHRSAGRHYVKVVTGELANVDRRPFAGPFAVRDTSVDAPGLEAGPRGSVLAVFTETDRVKDNIPSMAALRIEGPLQGAFAWERFDAKFGAFTDLFDGMEAYMSPGFHLLDGKRRGDHLRQPVDLRQGCGPLHPQPCPGPVSGGARLRRDALGLQQRRNRRRHVPVRRTRHAAAAVPDVPGPGTRPLLRGR